MTKCVVISPKCTSKTAKYIATSLEFDYCNPYKQGKYDFSEYDTVINWGVSAAFNAKKILNHFQDVDVAIDKVKTLKTLKGKAKTVEFTKDIDEALHWLNKGHIVVGRETSIGSRSSGVDFIDKKEDLFAKPYAFFTKYIDGIGEFRVNVLKGKVVSIQEKVEKNGEYTYKLLYGEPIKQIKDMVKAVDKNIGLDYYGLDVIADSKHIYHLLEVNSAPSLFGITSTRFVNKLKKEI